MADTAVQDAPELSILDVTYIYRGSTPTGALRNSTDGGRNAAGLGR